MNPNTSALATPAHILVVDDEPDLLTLYELSLLRAGYQVETAPSLAQARECLRQQRYDLLLTDMRLPDGVGLSLLREFTPPQRPEKVIVITAYGSAEGAVEALKAGAFDYVSKPIDLKQLRVVVAAALQTPMPQIAALAKAKPDLSKPPSTALHRLLGDSLPMRHVKERITKVASSMAPVMILGESGTGKELVARAIHEGSQRKGPFVAVNCGAIPDALLEAEFFGARKGAYTGATADRVGYFAAAKGGTLFLDELGDLPLVMQAKLLRVLQERRVRPLGGVQEEVVDVRIVCATHKDLQAAVEQGAFRQDLYYRLNVIDIRLPPLRERREDLEVLASGLLARLCQDHGHPPTSLTPAAVHWLHQQPFWGNVRELENSLHRALALSVNHCIDVDVLQDHPMAHMNTMSMGRAHAPVEPTVTAPTVTPITPVPVTDGPTTEPMAASVPPLPHDLQAYLDQIEKNVLVQALQTTKGHRTAAAALLGLNLRQIRYRIARLNIGEHDSQDGATEGDPHA